MIKSVLSGGLLASDGALVLAQIDPMVAGKVLGEGPLSVTLGIISVTCVLGLCYVAQKRDKDNEAHQARLLAILDRNTAAQLEAVKAQTETTAALHATAVVNAEVVKVLEHCKAVRGHQ